MILNCGGRLLDLSRPRVMAVLNVTPDSFSDGGRWVSVDAAVEHAVQMVEAGAALIDVGGESTRPGATPVDADDECARVLPVIERLAAAVRVPISIDTSKPEVMQAAVAAGAGFINDVRALREPGAIEAARGCGVPVCLMHMQGEPRSMQAAPHYERVVDEVLAFLEERVLLCEAAGIGRERLVIDPGFGFGKTLAHNIELLRGLDRFAATGLPVLAGISRKAMVGALTGERVAERRLAGSLAAAVLAARAGARILRVHDAAETVQALAVVHAVMDDGHRSD
ncbi:MAG: dihydropteroate synthase [Xanthomonadaceae bacterium]|nr:dihydropteroate synthase [Xanthomonadaceae bacterium]